MTQSPRFRGLLMVLAMVGMSLVATGCDWANVGGPW
jgi:hypothetical protein